VGGFYLGGRWLAINGSEATLATAAQYLAPMELRPAIIRQVIRHQCSHECSIVPTQDLPGGEWSHCPAWVMRSAVWRSVVALWQEHNLCGTIDAPRLAAWAVFGVMVLRAQEAKQRDHGRK
jgi:hypothetical protein